MRRQCSVSECDRPSRARGLCVVHYRRWWRVGHPTEPFAPISAERTPPPGFWSRVDFSDPDGCWLWAGARRHAYGEVYSREGKLYAHRVSYEVTRGRSLEPGEVVAHICDTPLCVRPDHLVATTPRQNSRDAWAKGRCAAVVAAATRDKTAAEPELARRPDRSGRAPGTGRDEHRSDESASVSAAAVQQSLLDAEPAEAEIVDTGAV